PGALTSGQPRLGARLAPYSCVIALIDACRNRRTISRFLQRCVPLRHTAPISIVGTTSLTLQRTIRRPSSDQERYTRSDRIATPFWNATSLRTATSDLYLKSAVGRTCCLLEYRTMVWISSS